LPTTDYNVVEDAKEMLKILEAEWKADDANKTKTVKPQKPQVVKMDDSDSDSSSDNDSDGDTDVNEVESEDDEDVDNAKHAGCNVKHGEIWNGFATLMTKIDVTYGAWGLYNYYRMEVRVDVFAFLQHSKANLIIFHHKI
jgi:hypothetical protein